MTHLVENMAYVGRTPWHGLGNQLAGQQPLEVWMREAGMAWEIRETPVRFISSEAGSLGQISSFPEQKVLFRSDNQAPLSVVSNRFKVVQPRDVLEFYRDLTEQSGFELETAGVLKGGRKLWALARTGQTGSLAGNDQTNGYVLLATACDGTLATTAQFTSIRVVCNNTLAVALNGNTHAVKVRHSTTFDPQAVKKQLGISVSAWDDFMYRLKTLSERRITRKTAEKVMQTIFTDTGYQPPGMPVKANEQAMKKAMALYDGAGRGSELASAKNTAYGLLNAVTEFVDHERRARSTDNRLDSAWFGKGAQIKQRALEQSSLLLA
jgi:phage/plasmid-like protein (TIGR03299 family)